MIAEVVVGKKGSVYKALKKLGIGTDHETSSFEIPSPVEAYLSAQITKASLIAIVHLYIYALK